MSNKLGSKHHRLFIYALFLLGALVFSLSSCHATLPLLPSTTPEPPKPSNDIDGNLQRRTGQFKIYLPFSPSPLPTGMMLPTPVPTTAGTWIVVAGKEIQLPADAYIAHHLIDVACVIGGDPCLEGPLYVLARGNSTMTVSIPSGIIYQEEIGAGDAAPFAFLKEELPH